MVQKQAKMSILGLYSCLFLKKKNLSSFLKFISNYSSFSPTAAGNGSSPNFFPSLASSAAFRILFHLYFPILVQNS